LQNSAQALRMRGDAIQIGDSADVPPLLEKLSGRAIVLLDLVMPRKSGEEVLGDILREFPDVNAWTSKGSLRLAQRRKCRWWRTFYGPSAVQWIDDAHPCPLR